MVQAIYVTLQAAHRAISSVLANPAAKPFASKVTDKIAPGYSEVISRPMDLGTIQSKLEKAEAYSSPQDVKADIALVSSCHASQHHRQTCLKLR